MKGGWNFLVEHNEAGDFHLVVVVVVVVVKNLPVGCGAFLGCWETPNAATTEGQVVSSRQANNKNVPSREESCQG